MHENGQNECSDWSPGMKPGRSLVNQRNRSDEPQQKEADARPAASER
jgi:hypothetical protein